MGPPLWGAWAWVLPPFQCKTRELPISNFEMDVWLCGSHRIAGEWKRTIGPIVAPCAFKGWLARVGPPVGVLGRGCYLVFNARLVSYRYPTSKWMSDCRSQLIARAWKQGRSVPLLPLALSRGGLHVWALPLGCLSVGANATSTRPLTPYWKGLGVQANPWERNGQPRDQLTLPPRPAPYCQTFVQIFRYGCHTSFSSKGD